MRSKNLDSINKSLLLLMHEIHAPRLKSWKNFETGSNIRYPDKSAELVFTQGIARSIADHYQLENITLIVELTDALKSKAVVELCSSNEIFIRYYRKDFIDVAILIPTLAHEVAHIFLDRKNLRFENTLENEILTDVTTIMLGFGELYLSAQDEITHRINFTERQTSKFRLGYLTPDEMGYVLAHRSCLTGEHSYRSISSETGRDAFIRGQKAFRKLQRRSPYQPLGWLGKRMQYMNKSNQAEKIEFDCLICKQPIRIPRIGKKLLVTCPNCQLKIPCHT